ncbi:MAG TPA: hypothetical protein VGL05_18915 [Kribbella sp.]
METGPRGAITFQPRELDVVRAALFTIEHYANQVWDQIEVHAVSGFAVDEFAALRQELDALRGD